MMSGDQDWGEADRQAEAASYPEFPSNPHNHRFTLSYDPQKPPFLVVRASTVDELTDAFEELENSGVYAAMGNAWRVMKAQATVGAGMGPTSVVPDGPPVQAVQPVPLPQSPQAQYPQPVQQYPGQPGTAPAQWQNVGAPPVNQQSQQQWGQQQQQGERPAYPAPQGWYRMQANKQQADATAGQYGIPKGNPNKGGKYNFFSAPVKAWYCAPDVVGAFQQYNPVPA